jgi:hypothetical protein
VPSSFAVPKCGEIVGKTAKKLSASPLLGGSVEDVPSIAVHRFILLQLRPMGRASA